MNTTFLDGILGNDHRSISRLISDIEAGVPVSPELVADLHAHSFEAVRIGITGPPGAGKSTLVDQLIGTLREAGNSVGVVAVDPTSPFTGGALLGDRVRMNRFAWDDNVFIRSMGSQGDLGGLARKTQDVGDILAASGKDYVIYETVGVGQGEHDVARAVDLTVVVLVPESGDEIQLMKAGLIEIADFFVINKSDRSGAGRLASVLRNLLHSFGDPDKLEPPVINTVAARGEGIMQLKKGILSHLDEMKKRGLFEKKRLERYRNRVRTIVHDRLLDAFWTSEKIKNLELLTASLDSVKTSPYTLADGLLKNETVI
ncbi:MAG: methylmalonyl Co-A mutase-associated GTPase MeaB [Fidelibacterota bacterium]